LTKELDALDNLIENFDFMSPLDKQIAKTLVEDMRGSIGKGKTFQDIARSSIISNIK